MLPQQPSQGNHEGTLARISRGMRRRGPNNNNPYGNGVGFHSGEHLVLEQRARRNRKAEKFILTHANPANVSRYGDFAGPPGPQVNPFPGASPPSAPQHPPPVRVHQRPHQSLLPRHPPHDNPRGQLGAPVIPLGNGASYKPETFPTFLLSQTPYFDPQSLTTSHPHGPHEVAGDAPGNGGYGNGYNPHFPGEHQGSGNSHGFHQFNHDIPSSSHTDIDDSGSYHRERPLQFWATFDS